MPPVFHPPESATPAVELTAEQENFRARPAPRKAPMSSLPKKQTKGGGKAKGAPKKRGKKKKAEEAESSGESLIVSDIKDMAFVEDPDDDSADDGGSSAGGESDDSEYMDASYVIVKRPTGKGATDKGVHSKTSLAKKTTTVSGGSARKVYTRKSAAAKSHQKSEGKSTPGKKGGATVGNTASENSNLLDDSEDGYYPDDENDENYLETSKTPTKRAAKKVTGGSVEKDTASKTTRRVSTNKKTPTKVTVKITTKSSLGRKALMGAGSEREQEGNNSNLLKEPPVTTAKKRKALSLEDPRFPKVAKTGSAKNVGVIKAGLELLSLGGADNDTGEAGGSMGQSFGALNTGCIVKGGTSEQRAAIIAANNQSHSVLQSDPVIGKNRLRYGGKSLTRLQALWEMGPPKYDSK